MQTKNKINIFITLLLSLLLFSLNVKAEEFNITAKEIIIDKEKEILIGKGSVKVKVSDGKLILANKVTYNKEKEFLLVEGQVMITDIYGNILKTNKATYDKINEKIITYDSSELLLKEGYKLLTKNILYETTKKILNSKNKSIFTDIDGNIIETSMFQYDIKNNLFSSVGKIKISDVKKNIYFFKEIHIDTKKNEMVGSNVSVVLDQGSFGVSEKSDPRFVANDILIQNNKTTLSKGVFTVCQKKDDDCPPWSIKAKKITHDQVKKNIYYDHAILKVYDIPVFYFPKFFHPDPTVKRQSGFLAPFFTNSTAVGSGFALPYYWAINNDRDLTFTPKIYAEENILLLNEYRQAFKNGFLTLDTSFTEGYKNNSNKKNVGSSNHIFANLDLNLNQNKSYESDLSIKIQRTSNNTYFRNHKINTTLVDSEDTNLKNEIKYSFSNDDSYLDISTLVYQNLRNKKKSDQYEYVLPNIIYGKTFFSEKFGTLNFKSSALYNKYETNKQKAFLTNDIVWNPLSNVTKNGFVSTLQGMIRNTNYETKNTKNSDKHEEYKDGNIVKEISAVIAQKVSLPMKKDGTNFSNIFSPNFMVRLAPSHMRNLSSKNDILDHNNLYSLNKTSEIESGLSAVLGFDFKINKKINDKKEIEKLSVSLGQIFNHEKNRDRPSKSSLDQKMSDIVGNIEYNFSEIGKINYNFSVDHNINDINYNEISTELNFGKVQFNLDYLEEQNHVGTEHYASPGITINFNDHNTLKFDTKKNFKTDSTELYNLSYQYGIDCLTAGVVYRRQFYQDSDTEPNDTLMFTITFVPFGAASSPTLAQ